MLTSLDDQAPPSSPKQASGSYVSPPPITRIPQLSPSPTDILPAHRHSLGLRLPAPRHPLLLPPPAKLPRPPPHHASHPNPPTHTLPLAKADRHKHPLRAQLCLHPRPPRRPHHNRIQQNRPRRLTFRVAARHSGVDHVLVVCGAGGRGADAVFHAAGVWVGGECEECV